MFDFFYFPWAKNTTKVSRWVNLRNILIIPYNVLNIQYTIRQTYRTELGLIFSSMSSKLELICELEGKDTGLLKSSNSPWIPMVGSFSNENLTDEDGTTFVGFTITDDSFSSAKNKVNI